MYDPNCPTLPYSRGLCAKHYSKAFRAGTLDKVALPSKVKNSTAYHKLSSINPITKTATCLQCGTAEIFYRKDRNSWKCRNKAKQWYNTYTYGDGKILDRVEVETERIRLTNIQNGLCAICKLPTESLVLDHCHDTGKIRGLLCGTCNTGLGMFRDSVETVRAATDYLSQ